MAAIYSKKNRTGFFVNLGGMTITLGKTQSEAHARYAEILAGKPYKAKQGWLCYLDSQIVPADAPAPVASPVSPAVEAATANVVTGPTLGEVVDKWCAYIEANSPKATVQSYTRYAKRWAGLHGHKAAASIIGADVNEAKDKLYPRVNNDATLNNGKPYSGACRKQHVKVAKQIFLWAKEQGFIKFNSIEELRSKGDSYGRREADLSREQFDKLLAACDDPLFRDVLIILWDTGCRPKEAFDATAKHLDREARCLRYAKGKMGKPRIVYLTDRAFDILARLADQHGEGALLRNRIGRKWTVGSTDARLKVLDAKTGVKATSYVFRHAFCTRHVKAGTNLVQLKDLMGHSSLRMISEVYAHVGGDSVGLRAALAAA